MADNNESPNFHDEAVVDIVAAYVSNNDVPIEQLDTLFQKVRENVGRLGQPVTPTPAEPETAKASTADIRKSITPDFLVSFVDGKQYKSLKRHLTKHGMTPAEYKTKWGLPGDYPMVAPNYSAARSAMARAIGLGAKGRGRIAASLKSVPQHPVDAAPAKRGPGRPAKAAAAAAPAKRGPGRPPKAQAGAATAPAKRGPGRPKKVTADAAPAKRGPGRPKKNAG